MSGERGKSEKFPETRWSLIQQVAGSDDNARKRALDDLCALYWDPVFAFIQAQGHSKHDAEDLTQGFFSRFLAREDFSKPNESRGKLRSYLLSSVKHYLTDQYRWNSREKRGGKVDLLSIDEEADRSDYRGRSIEPADAKSDPEKVFRQQWATSMLESVLLQLEARYVEDEQALLFDALRPFVSLDADTERQSEIAQRIGMTPNAFRQSIHRMKQRYGQLLRQAVADTLQPGEDVDAEVQELLAAFA